MTKFLLLLLKCHVAEFMPLQTVVPSARCLSLKEHQGISLLKQAGIPVAPYAVAKNADILMEEAIKIGKYH